MALNKRVALVGGLIGGASAYTLFSVAPATMAAITNPIAGLLAGFLSTSMASVAAMIAVSVAAVLVAAVVAMGIQMLVSKFGAAKGTVSAPASEEGELEKDAPAMAHKF